MAKSFRHEIDPCRAECIREKIYFLFILFPDTNMEQVVEIPFIRHGQHHDADGLATQSARASATMLMAKVAWVPFYQL